MDNLRLILLALGVVVVAAIWAFESWRRRRNAAARDDPFADFDSDDLAIDELPPWDEQADDAVVASPSRRDTRQTSSAARGRREPGARDLFDEPLDDVDDDGPPLGDLTPLVASNDEPGRPADAKPRPPATKAADASSPAGARRPVEDKPRPPARPPRETRAVSAGSGGSGSGAASASSGDGDAAEAAGKPSVAAAEPENTAEARPAPGERAARVVSLMIMARPGRRFVGHQVRAALESVGLRYGEMQIFHYHDDDEDDTPLFSAVNALKPGTFDLARLGELSTTGVALFMQVPGPGDPRRVFELMLDTARHLAERLGGDLGDAARRPLSAARLAELRATAAGDDTP